MRRQLRQVDVTKAMNGVKWQEPRVLARARVQERRVRRDHLLAAADAGVAACKAGDIISAMALAQDRSSST